MSRDKNVYRWSLESTSLRGLFNKDDSSERLIQLTCTGQMFNTKKVNLQFLAGQQTSPFLCWFSYKKQLSLYSWKQEKQQMCEAQAVIRPLLLRCNSL